MYRREVNSEYFKWLCDIVCGDMFSPNISYKKLLTFLHETEFTYSIFNDEDRAKNGEDLRRKFAREYCLEYDICPATVIDYLEKPCSVLEMMIALSIACERFMDDPEIGDRTRYWFWNMISSLGLKNSYDMYFSKKYVEEVIDRFLNHEYEPDGKGGLFTIRNCDKDLRKYGIWYQLCWYLDSIYV